MNDFPITDKNQVRRMPARAAYDPESVYAVMDEARLCHVSFAVEGQPYVLPLSFARIGEEIFFHGSRANRLLSHIAAGNEVCMAFTLLDGLVMARSAFHHSVNYRSVVAFGSGREVTDKDLKCAALKAVVGHLAPGRWEEVRPPSDNELDATMVVSVTVESASAKSRSGPPVDGAEDYVLPVWAGVLPLHEAALEPIPDPKLAEGVPVSGSVARLVGQG